MDTETAMRALAALAIVLGLIGGLYWALRRFTSLTPSVTDAGELRVKSWRPFDGRKKLAVVQWGDQEHLILTGQAQDLLIASRSVPRDAAAESGEDN